MCKRSIDEGIFALLAKKPKSNKGKCVSPPNPINITNDIDEFERNIKGKGIVLFAHPQKHVKQPARFKGFSKSKLVDEPTNSDKDDSDFPSSKSLGDTDVDEEGI
uniref:Uncharacterized protein n=1 Tax=Solanum tuberosum TaxID=4113 RepID=M1DID5_SOLTU